MLLTVKKIIISLISLGVMTVSGYAAISNQKIVQEEIKDIEDSTKIATEVRGAPESEIQNLLALTHETKDENENKGKESFNVLGVGKSGNLTDSIVVANINEDKQKVTLISIPRDLDVKGLKINHIHYYYGIEKLKEVVENVTGLKIDKYGLLNFDGFRALIDAVDGIDIEVDKKIKDYTYNYFIEPGLHHFTGQQALRFSRSRYSTSDFDRAKRQQEVLEAFMEKIKRIDLLKNPEKAFTIYNALKNNFETDISIWEALEFYDKYKDYKIDNEHVLSTADLLYSKLNESQAYVLLPRSGNFKQIHEFVNKLIN